METIFPYVNTLRGDGSRVATPLVPFSFAAANGDVQEAFGLIDSGADVMLLPNEFLRFIDSGKTRSVRARSFAGETCAQETSITITIGGKTITMPAFIAETRNTPILLGREGFFDAFTITFQQARQAVILRDKG